MTASLICVVDSLFISLSTIYRLYNIYNNGTRLCKGKTNTKNGVRLRLKHPLDSGFNPKKRTVVLIHGFQCTSGLSALHEIKEATLKRHNVNIIIFDYGIYATTYDRVIKFYKQVGVTLGKFLLDLQAKTNFTWDSLHMIGHSAGVHVMSYAARTLPQKPGRLTGLDPSNLRHRMKNRIDFISPNDAFMVDCIHTSTSFGSHDALCTCDYYANNGVKQNGCVTELCNHMSAYNYYLHSLINIKEYPSRRCNNLTAADVSDCGDYVAFAGILGNKECKNGTLRFDATLSKKDLESIVKMETDVTQNLATRLLRTIGMYD